MNKSNDLDFTITLDLHKDKVVRLADELEGKTSSLHETINLNKTHFGPISIPFWAEFHEEIYDDDF